MRVGGVRGAGGVRGGVREPRRLPRGGLPEAREPPAAARRQGPPALRHRRRARLLLHVCLQLLEYCTLLTHLIRTLDYILYSELRLR